MKPSGLLAARFALLVLLALISMANAGPFARADNAGQSATVFAMPQVMERLQILTALASAGRAADGLTMAGQGISAATNDPTARFTMAYAYALNGMPDKSIEALGKAADLGFAQPALVAAIGNLGSLANNDAFKQVAGRIQAAASKVATKSPGTVSDRTATVDEANTVWDDRRGVLVSAFAFAAGKPGQAPAAIPSNPALSKLIADGRAAGNSGDLYDNRDGGHSKLERNANGELTFVEYGPLAKQYRVNDGANLFLRFNAPTVGNCSKALVSGPLWRSLPRLVLTQPIGPMSLFDQYIRNMLYVYPAHHDHDPEMGDLFPANTPYMIVSQGSSGSDMPFVEAVAQILAAFRPDVKSALVQSGLLMPTTQMIFRRGQSWVKNDEDYLSGAAHPSVFDSGAMSVTRMVALAQSLTIADVPPLVALEVVKEDEPARGRETFEPDTSVLFTTPAAIARVYRTTARAMHLTVRARTIGLPSQPKNEPKLIWRLLRGNEAEVSIIPSADGAQADISIGWQQRRRVPGRPELSSNRVDIGVFADNGRQLSAPSFISVLLPSDQRRAFTENSAPLKIEYSPSELDKRYVDPAIFPRLGWTDTYSYDGTGRLLGWVRTRDGTTAKYTRDGARVEEEDSLGRPVRARIVSYGLKAGDGRSQIVESDTDREIRYSYESDTDKFGKPSQ